MDSFDDEDYAIDLRDLVSQLPTKRDRMPAPALPPMEGLHLRTPSLAPPALSEQLFSVTRTLRRMDQALQLGSNNPKAKRLVMGGARLANDKVARMMLALGGVNPEFELDATTRGRFYARGAPTPFPRDNTTAEMATPLDREVAAFLSDKENQVPEPSKKRAPAFNLGGRPLSSGGFSGSPVHDPFGGSSEMLPSPNSAWNTTPSKLPVLQKIDLNLGKRKRDDWSDGWATSLPQRLPKRRRVPAPRTAQPARLALRGGTNRALYLVELLTGKMLEATIFATELNQLLPDEFPFPEGPDEMVQIPTNLDCGAKRMAIIRMVQHELSEPRPRRRARVRWKQDLEE